MRILLLATVFVLLNLSRGIGMSIMPPYEEKIFSDPVKGEIFLSGTFGELRANHFHAGVDIKGFIGKPLFAASDGFVARVKVEEGGYGKALYIKHPNGYTTVYAHLDNFTPEIEAWIKAEQYRRRTYAVDLQPKPGQFTFRSGESIGNMGTTGYSFGPHLHFEVRRSDIQRPMNPLFFGVKIRDKIAPVFRELKVYELDDRKNSVHERKVNVYKSTRGYRLSKDTLYISSPYFGFGLMAYDQMNGVPNRNGLYRLSLYDEDELHYRMEMQSFSFGETRYLNAHLDYAEKTLNRRNYYRTYVQPGNRASIYVEVGGDGTLRLEDGEAKKIVLLGSDFSGNEAPLTFWVKKSKPSNGTLSPEEVKIPLKTAYCKGGDAFRACFEKGSFYSDLDIPLTANRVDSLSVYSPIYTLGDPGFPIHRYFSLRLAPENLPAQKRDKAIVAYLTEKGDVINLGAKWEGDYLLSRSRSFGRFFVTLDEEPPTIKPYRFKADMRNASSLRFIIQDNVGTSGRARRLRYRGTIDGKWVLFGFDAKNSLLWHDFGDGKIGPGEHEVRIEVRDDRNNLAVWKGKFTR